MDWLGISGLVVGIIALVYAVKTHHKFKRERDLLHLALVNLKPSIQGPNRDDVVAAINNMLAVLKPPKS
jgi:hypothetical protein